jgi:hypothetical protein
MAQEDPNIFFRELIKSKPDPDDLAAWLANHVRLIELVDVNGVRERPVVGYPGYFVRDDGMVRLRLDGRLTKGFLSCFGYPTLSLHKDNKGKNTHVHILVAKAFVENPRPDIFDMVDHIDCVRTNNHYSNLRWVDNELNSANRKNSKNVSFHKGARRWVGCFQVGGKRRTKYFATEAEAFEWAQREKKKAWQKLYAEKIGQTKP